MASNLRISKAGPGLDKSYYYNSELGPRPESNPAPMNISTYI
ncbi:hypothetical protein CCACVL1_27477 [Corchorus capsularis]|uniref:Uncharacterized protein n=1 Tax=Corchorus capsularis TaxID=210143 RepID=A0A1R3G9Y7_COCAP|nr:hypothetical protein CCACVL1_27477 [Corchorus capsularis]